jgi:hypothetical protein
VVLGIAVLPACSAASKAGSTTQSQSTPSSQTGPTQSTGDSGSTKVTSNRSARIRVRPGSGHRQTRFQVTFTAPERTGTVSGATRRYEVGANTPQTQGCVASATKFVGATHAGARVSTMLTPVGGHWCTGTYKGRILETVTPPCAPGKLCPAFIEIAHVVGTFRFRVS